MQAFKAEGLRRAGLAVLLAVGTAGCVAAAPTASGTSPTNSPASPKAVASAKALPTGSHAAPATAAPSILELRGAYTFNMQVDPDGTCKWPVKSLVWPVRVEQASGASGADASIVFTAKGSPGSSKWAVSVTPSGTQLSPVQGSPGAASAAYALAVEGGRWQGAAPVPGFDGRAEIKSGTASSPRLLLTLPGSGQQLECRSDATWSLLARWIDRD